LVAGRLTLVREEPATHLLRDDAAEAEGGVAAAGRAGEVEGSVAVVDGRLGHGGMISGAEVGRKRERRRRDVLPELAWQAPCATLDRGPSARVRRAVDGRIFIRLDISDQPARGSAVGSTRVAPSVTDPS